MHETICPVLADPSYTLSADYGVAMQDFFGMESIATTLIIDREGSVRFKYRARTGSFDRPPVDRLLKTIDGFNKT